MPGLEVNDLHFAPVLRNVNLDFEPGQMVAIVGPNGAGKSTLLKLLAGLWTPTAGTVRWQGQEIHAMKAKARARQIAYVPQQWPDAIPFTVAEFVTMGGYAHQTDRRKELPVLLRRMGLSDYQHQPLQLLSGGERQRAVLARSLYQGSDLLLLDEPIANLDLFYQLEILNTLKQLAATGKLVILAIHHLEFALQFCETSALIHQHTVFRSGVTSEVLTEQALQEVFIVPVKRFIDPFTNTPRLSYSEVEGVFS